MLDTPSVVVPAIEPPDGDVSARQVMVGIADIDCPNWSSPTGRSERVVPATVSGEPGIPPLPRSDSWIAW